MNQIEEVFMSLLDMGMDVLASALKGVTAADLEFTPPGDNVSLGELCRGMGDVAYAYAESFRTGTMDFSLSAEDRHSPRNGKELAEWIRAQEELLKNSIRRYSDEELNTKVVDRGGGWEIQLQTQFHVYREALLIFFGKLDVYLRLMKKERPEQWVQWVG